MVLNAKLTKREKQFGYQLIWFNQGKHLQNNVGNGKMSKNTFDNSEIKVEVAKMEEMLKVYTKQFKLDSKKVIGVFDIFSDRPSLVHPERNMAELANVRYVITRGEAFDDAAGPVFGPLIKRMRSESQ
jgi:hypothetical protein